jgi:hypothetical protein
MSAKPPGPIIDESCTARTDGNGTGDLGLTLDPMTRGDTAKRAELWPKGLTARVLRGPVETARMTDAKSTTPAGLKAGLALRAIPCAPTCTPLRELNDAISSL